MDDYNIRYTATLNNVYKQLC